MVVLNLQPVLPLTDDVFEQLCRQNPDLRLERTAQGELIAMAPADSETGYYNADLLGQLWEWNRQQGLGIVLDSSAGFALPNGAIRSPDAAWITQPRWYALTPEQRRRFAPSALTLSWNSNPPVMSCPPCKPSYKNIWTMERN